MGIRMQNHKCGEVEIFPIFKVSRLVDLGVTWVCVHDLT